MSKVLKVFKGLLAGLMAVSLVSVYTGGATVANAEEAPEEWGEKWVTGSSLAIAKTADIAEDGTYDITLKSFSTGNKTIIEKNVPVDLILVLDVSGSMDENFNGYGSGKKLAALKTAVGSFVDVVAEKNQKAKDTSEMSRVALVKFADNHTKNNSSFADYKNNIGDDTYHDRNYKDYFNNTQVVNDLVAVDNAQATSLKSKVNGLHASGATATDYGMNYAQAILNANPVQQGSGRKQVVIMFTDGLPTYAESWDNGVAKRTITTAKALKDNSVSVYTVAIYNGAEPELNPRELGTSGSDRINRFLHAVSSNYPDATGYANSGNNGSIGQRKADSKYYFAAKNASELNNIFTSIAEETGGTTTKLTEEAVMKDIVASSFTLPEGFNPNNLNDVELHVYKWDETNNTWSDEEDEELKNNLVPEVPEGTNTLNVRGFDYSTHYLSRTKEGDSYVYPAAGINKDARMLVVIIHGVEAKTSSITGDSMVTNEENSGIYENSDSTTPVLKFPQPEVTFTSKSFVIDYMKPFEIDYSSVLSTVERVDDPSDDVLKGLAAVSNSEMKEIIDALPAEYKDADGNLNEAGQEYLSSRYFNFAKAYETTNGAVKFEEVHDEEDPDTIYKKEFKLTYYPKTTTWNGYDNLFVKGESKTAAKLNAWGKLTIIPANNVYYEDTFSGNFTIEGDHASTQAGLNDVTIEYTGIAYGGTWNEDGTAAEGQTTEDPNGEVHGWTETLADDTQYSDGTAHHAEASKENKASATFSFNGTGVDVYSRTKGDTGTILATITGTKVDAATGKVYKKAMAISNKAANGDFYQIPTCSFNGLPYDTYTVKINVTTADKNRLNYYLDGIRVYNPIQNKEGDDVVKEAYENELGASFTEIRTLLTDGSALYIDENAEGNTEDALTASDYLNSDVAKFAPNHEVYLAKNGTVTFSAAAGNHYYVGIKAPQGESKVKLTTESSAVEKTISHSTDLYYEVVPNKGSIVITNTGDNIISLTKLRITTGTTDTADAGQAIDADDVPKLLSFAKTFRTMSVEAVEDDETVTEDSEIQHPEVEIVEEPAEPEEPGEGSGSESGSGSSNYGSWWSWLFGGFRGFLRP